jgi:hypothetical protein
MPETSIALQKLAELGVDVETIPAGQRAVLADLSDEEATVLARVLDRLAPEVEGHTFAAIKPAATPGTAGTPKLADHGSLFW